MPQTSQYRGVHWDRVTRAWRACIRNQGYTKCLGSFLDEEEAARAYDAAAKRVWLNAQLNWLPDGSLNPDRKMRIDTKSLIRRSTKEEPHEHRHPSFSSSSSSPSLAHATRIIISSSGGSSSSSSSSSSSNNNNKRPRLLAVPAQAAAATAATPIATSPPAAAAAAAVPAVDAVVAFRAYVTRQFMRVEESAAGSSEEHSMPYGDILTLLLKDDGPAHTFVREAAAEVNVWATGNEAAKAKLLRKFVALMRAGAFGAV